MPFSTGQTIRVRKGVSDPDTGVSLAGWTGAIIEIEDDLLLIQWDAPTLARMPASYVEDSIAEGYEFERYLILPESVELVQPGGKQSARPPDLKKQLLAAVQDIQGNGVFCVSGDADFVPPGLEVKGFGEIALPLATAQAKALIKEAKAAPYGKGSQTITDPAVRSAWEIDAGRLKFRNPAWEQFLNTLLKDIQVQMGIERAKITASLYKLLIYQKGDFFLPHKDSEKEKGMFATLTIGLPSAHTGGELLVRFDGWEKRADFSAAASNYRIPFAAFYADCEHEIKPLESGYRICLVYNLLQTSDKRALQPPRLSGSFVRLYGLLEELKKGFGPGPIAVLLGHQYTPANFSISELKGHDRPRAQALLSAAEQAGYFAKAGLLTHYRIGELQDDYYFLFRGRGRRGRRYDDFEEEESAMGQIYEETTLAEHWADDDMPGLGKLEIRKEDILSPLEIGEGEPTEQEEEGFTGNAGMTLEYWYHYGAIFLWPHALHSDLLEALPLETKLEWVHYYVKNWKHDKLFGRNDTHLLLIQLAHFPGRITGSYREDYNYNPVAKALTLIEDEKFVSLFGPVLMEKFFAQTDAAHWKALVKKHGAERYDRVFEWAGSKGEGVILRHLLKILRAFEKAGMGEFVRRQLLRLPAGLEAAKLHSPGKTPVKTITGILEDLLALSHHCEKDEAWMERIKKALCENLSRTYVNDALAPALTAKGCPRNRLYAALREACLADLEKRTAVKPQPPADWRRKTPKSIGYQHVWDMLAPFLNSTTETVFDYPANQNKRDEVENALRSANVDLRTETIRRGSPHTLRLIKTQASYERALKEWEEDMGVRAGLTP
jgi:hypothetical protein